MTDDPIVNTTVMIRAPDYSGGLVFGRFRILAQAQTNDVGEYQLVSEMLPPNTPVNLVKGSPDNAPFVTITADKDGKVDTSSAPMPVAVPVRLRWNLNTYRGNLNETTTVFGDQANPGARILLYASDSGELLGSDRANAGGNFALILLRATTDRRGRLSLRVTQLDDFGLESSPVDAGETTLPEEASPTDSDPPATTTEIVEMPTAPASVPTFTPSAAPVSLKSPITTPRCSLTRSGRLPRPSHSPTSPPSNPPPAPHGPSKSGPSNPATKAVSSSHPQPHSRTPRAVPAPSPEPAALADCLLEPRRSG
jgi:hypothetical protein